MKKTIITLLIVLFTTTACGFTRILRLNSAEVASCERTWNNEQGFQCLRRLALANDTDEQAQSSLAFRYYMGKGVLKNYDQAVYWFTKSAKQGNLGSQYFLGSMYHEGKGVVKNNKQAYVWMSIAVYYGMPDKVLEDITKEMSNAEITEAQNMAQEIMKTMHEK